MEEQESCQGVHEFVLTDADVKIINKKEHWFCEYTCENCGMVEQQLTVRD